MWMALLIGILIGHFGSQWLSYKNVMFKVVNHAIMCKVDHKGKRLLDKCLCRRHHPVAKRQFDVGMMMNVLKSLSSITTPQQMMTLAGMAQGVMGHSTNNPTTSTRQRKDSHVNHNHQHQTTHHQHQPSHQQAHPTQDPNSSDSNTPRRRIPLRKPSSYLLATD